MFRRNYVNPARVDIWTVGSGQYSLEITAKISQQIGGRLRALIELVVWHETKLAD